ncbi:2Fe-2S iron-sulfur cluster-binding protein [Imbroritus primus]|uniref:2Fe-2S iron-sulfur cluster-binding protein n=1 Tax=Imbroritus primus TaxID=3058603 RepID=UPI003D161424
MKTSASEPMHTMLHSTPHAILIRTPSGTAGYRAMADERLLDAGLRAGHCLPYECATGTCGQCRATVLHGQHRDLWPEAPAAAKLRRERGEVLMCQTAACGPLEVALPKGAEQMLEPHCWPARQQARVSGLRLLNADIIELRLELSAPLDFLPGQFVLLGAPGVTGYRAYSMVNHDMPATALTLLIKRKPDGDFSTWLFQTAREGMRVDLFGPLGKATFEADTMQDIVCIAGGSGIAGMMSIVGAIHGQPLRGTRRTDMFFGVRAAHDLFYASELNALAERSNGLLQVTVALSEVQPAPALIERHPALRFAHGFVHEVAMHGLRPGLETPTAFLAGPPVAVDAGIRMLMKQKFPLQRIRFDRFG